MRARKSIEKISNAVANAGEALDAPLEFYANWISRIRDAKSIPDWAAKLTPQKNNLRWLMEAALLRLSEEQAHGLTVMIRSMISPVRARSEERRVGTEGGRRCRSRGTPDQE